MKLKPTVAALAALGMGLGITMNGAMAADDDVIRIGFITDMSSVYSDVDGKKGAEAIKMAIEEFDGEIDGKKIELVTADHQMKADIASAKAREWIDTKGVKMIIGGTNSATALATAKVAADKKVPYIQIGAGSVALTNDQCSPYTVHYAYDTAELARGTGSAVVKDGGDSWYFLTADYAFGHSLEEETAAVVEKSEGEVKGRSRIPLGTSDFSSFILKAQSSGAKILGLANAGGDLINSIKSANDFGANDTMNYAALLMFINDVHALGLEATQGLYLTTSWYWDLNDDTREWANKFKERTGDIPSMLHAGDYSAVRYYLEGVKETGTTDGDKVMEWMKSNKINDMFVKDGYIRPDGRMITQVYLAQVKTPDESKGEWDYYNIVENIKGEDVYITKEESTCEYWKD